MRYIFVWIELKEYHKIVENSSYDPRETFFVKPSELFAIEKSYKDNNIDYELHFIGNKSEKIKQDYRDWYLDDTTYLKELYKANYK